jgi:radical SAM protein with 4Fe4S-binding SPASM domain
MGVPGALLKVVESVRKYVDRRFDVRCIPVLTSQNYQETYDIIRLAKQLGMDSVFVDRYEAGGLGTKQAEMLKPSIRQFREALTQMIAARDDFNMPVGFGTAIPFCLDERLLTENMYADCGVGTTFAAISPSGEFRLCNQSQIVYGNVLEKPIETIWKSKRIDEDFRSLQWVTEPCWSCALLSQCLCGCKVDLNCSDKYCVDYSVRGLKGPPAPVKGLSFKQSSLVFPGLYRRFEPNRYTKINKSHQEFYLVTRYQTIVLDSLAAVMLERILQEVRSEEHLIRLFSELAEEVDIRGLVTQLLNIGAIEPSE